MHPEAYAGVRRMVDEAKGHGLVLDQLEYGLDVGGQDVNGTARDHFPNTTWTTCDLNDPTAELRQDARLAVPRLDGIGYDVVLSTEMLEHMRWWPLTIRTAWDVLDKGFIFLTAASTNRGPHGAQGEPEPPPGEWYENVDPIELRDLIVDVFRPEAWGYIHENTDVYAWLKKT